MSKGGVIQLRVFCPGRTLTSQVSFGLAWDITEGVSIDLDASAICLSQDLGSLDVILFKQLKSKDNAIVHTGDCLRGEKAGDDETINICLDKVDRNTRYIGIVVNSYSQQELDYVAAASCHVYDTRSKRDMARYTLTNVQALDKHTALAMGCLYRDDGENGEWMLRINSEAAQGRTVHDNVDELQNFLRKHPAPKVAAINEEEEEIDLSMPDHLDHDDEEIVVMPLEDLNEEEIVIPPH